MRIFYLEPFLIKPERHFIEVTLSLNDLFSRQNTNEFFIVGNKRLDNEVEKLFPTVIPGITQTCFEDLNNKGMSFFHDLQELDKKYTWTTSDLFIIPTAYENQILGVSSFLQHKRIVLRIALQFHQLFPPTGDSEDVLKHTFQAFWMNRLKEAFSKISSNTVSLWTTESNKLNRAIQKLSRRRVGMLPFPYPPWHSDYLGRKKHESSITRLGFLGEGRQEKGLLFFLQAIHSINKIKNTFEFVIQNMNPRGYSPKQMKKFIRALNTVKKYRNVTMVEGGIEPKKFHTLLQSLDGIVLPYNPVNYCRRVSGLLIQAALYGIPSIISEGTWGARTLKNNHAAGIIFRYDLHKQTITNKNLYNAIQKFQNNIRIMQKKAESSSFYFRKHCSAKEYIKRIINFYEKT